MQELTIDIKKILNDYSLDIQEAIAAEAQAVAKQAANELKHTSPKRTGKYAKGWRVKTTKGQGFIECEVHNAEAPGLTHLLEESHLLRNGRKSTPKVHIKPVEEKANREFEQAVEKIIQNGG